jgi:hypothetical protein
MRVWRSCPRPGPRELGGARIVRLAPMTWRWMCSRSPTAGASSPRARVSVFCSPTTWPIARPAIRSSSSSWRCALLPGLFDDADACRCARAFLIPEELLEREELECRSCGRGAWLAGRRASGSARRASGVGARATADLTVERMSGGRRLDQAPASGGNLTRGCRLLRRRRRRWRARRERHAARSFRGRATGSLRCSWCR